MYSMRQCNADFTNSALVSSLDEGIEYDAVGSCAHVVQISETHRQTK